VDDVYGCRNCREIQGVRQRTKIEQEKYYKEHKEKHEEGLKRVPDFRKGAS
jgi:hypothetical protein